VHHSASSKDTTPDQIAQWHLGRNWAGIGYHFVVRRGRVYYTGDVLTARANVAGHNDYTVGVCVTGNYGETALDERHANALADLLDVLDAHFGEPAWYGHRDLGATACPGDALYDWLTDDDAPF